MANTTSSSSALPFVKRLGSTLYLERDGLADSNNQQKLQPFRFVSYNVPNLHVLEDPYWHIPTPWEQEDALRSVSQIGGKVVRIYTLSFRKSSDPPELKRHVYPPNSTVLTERPKLPPSTVQFTYDEDLFRALDTALDIARNQSIYLIIPFIDNYEWWGGIESFVQYHPHTPPPSSSWLFFTDPYIRSSFKSLVSAVINRNNTVNGIRYADDPTILAWQLGNELTYSGGRVPAEWTRDMAAFVKGLDSKHLVMDGSYGKYGWDGELLADPNVDIFDGHYYPGLPSTFEEVFPFFVTGVIGIAALLVLILAVVYPSWVWWLRVKMRDQQQNNLGERGSDGGCRGFSWLSGWGWIWGRAMKAEKDGTSTNSDTRRVESTNSDTRGVEGNDIQKESVATTSTHLRVPTQSSALSTPSACSSSSTVVSMSGATITSSTVPAPALSSSSISDTEDRTG
ncbi:hypothetical protein HK102_011288, partial [Quaeritorhiza haematococci]